MAASYLTTIEVIAIHDVLIDAFGGSHGIRDMGALESAIFRPQSGYYADEISEAAALWESLMLNHAFIDGNKRTAVAAADAHLRLNGWVLDVDSGEAAIFIEELFRTPVMRITRIEPWLRDRVQRL